MARRVGGWRLMGAGGWGEEEVSLLLLLAWTSDSVGELHSDVNDAISLAKGRRRLPISVVAEAHDG